jgi:hypothetical protein
MHSAHGGPIEPLFGSRSWPSGPVAYCAHLTLREMHLSHAARRRGQQHRGEDAARARTYPGLVALLRRQLRRRRRGRCLFKVAFFDLGGLGLGHVRLGRVFIVVCIFVVLHVVGAHALALLLAKRRVLILAPALDPLAATRLSLCIGAKQRHCFGLCIGAKQRLRLLLSTGLKLELCGKVDEGLQYFQRWPGG